MNPQTEHHLDLWSSILGEVRVCANRKLSVNKTLLVLGNAHSGKSSLIAALQGTVCRSVNAGLEYQFLRIRDAYGDEKAFLNVWLLNDEMAKTKLIRFALNEANFENTIVMLVVSLAEPWHWPSQLREWLQVLIAHVDALKIDGTVLRAAQRRLVAAWQEYANEDFARSSTPTKSRTLRRTHNLNLVDLDAMLPEGTLQLNLGLEFIVVATKADVLLSLERDCNYTEAHFDYMQCWLRRYCLQLGASLFYTSTKAQACPNCAELHKYLMARINKQPHDLSPKVFKHEMTFVPAGWDTLNKINLISEQEGYLPKCDYETFIRRPKEFKSCSMCIVETVDEQEFFASLVKKENEMQSTRDAGTAKSSENTCALMLKTGACTLDEFFKGLLRNKESAGKQAEESSAAKNDDRKTLKAPVNEGGGTPMKETAAEALERVARKSAKKSN